MSALDSREDQRVLQDVTRLADEGAAGVSGLLALLSHRSWSVRRAVVAALSHAGPEALSEACRQLVVARTNEPVIAGLVDALSLADSSVELLVRPLLESADPAVLCDALQILGRRQDTASTARLIELTDHPDDNVALSAIEALGRIGGAAAVDRLMELAEGNSFFRTFPAIELLGRAREARALPVLQRLLQQPLYATEAARAIGRVGSLAGAPALVRSMETAPESLLRVEALSLVAISDQSPYGSAAGSALSRLVREHAKPSLRDKIARAMSFADPAETVALGRVLIWLGSEESVDDFIRLLDNEGDIAALAIEGLTRLSALGDPRVLAALAEGTSDLRARLLPSLLGVAAASQATIACLHDEQATVRALACHALARGRDLSAIPRLFELLTDADLGVVHAAVGAIQSLGSSETERLALQALKSENVTERRAALRIITYFGYDDCLKLCLEALASPDERLRDIALAGLPALDEPRVPDVLIEASRHASARTRAAALRALGHVRLSPATEDVLRAALDDEDGWVRYYACQSLGRLRVEAALPLLVARLGDDAGHVKVAAVEALASLPGDGATEALAQAAGSADVDVQRAALVGIGERAEARLRPLLQAALQSPDSSIRLVAVSSLARFEAAETELSAVAAGDADAAVRGAALELLASSADGAATNALLTLLTSQPDSAPILAALAQGVDARLPAILRLLERADDNLARALLGVISRAESRPARAALDTAFVSRNVASRRAAARALSMVLDDSAKSSLARAASADPDAEVRRLCAAALA